MERRIIIFWVAWFAVIVLVALIITLNLNAVELFLGKNVQKYGYPSVFLLGGLTDAVDQPIGPEVIAGLGTGFGLNVLIVFILVSLGSILVSHIHFYIGKRYLSQKVAKSCSTKRYGGLCKLFNKYGSLVLLFGALTPVPYVFTIWMSSAFGVNYRTFLAFGPLARALRIGLIALIVAGLI
jgi:membrane protein YqaA with SNARE-associated domain